MTHNAYLLIATSTLLAVLISVVAYYSVRPRQSAHVGWEELLQRLTWVDRDNIAQVALDLVDESGQPREVGDVPGLEPSELWSLIGGLKGLEVLEKNSDILIDLAFYVQQWYPEAVTIAERLRLDSRELKWHVARLRGAAQTGNLQISFPFYAQRAVVAYYLMTRRLLELYAAQNLTMFADLQRAI
jgi:hypothetical protein